jgi:hypothetical protein
MVMMGILKTNGKNPQKYYICSVNKKPTQLWKRSKNT